MGKIRSTKSTARNIIGVGSSRFGKVTDNFLTATSNYWGNGSDGSLTVGSNGQNTVLASSQDGDVVVKQYSYLRILNGYTLTVSNRCRGLALYVDGDCLIEGNISMSGGGAYTPNILSEVDANGLRFIRRKTGQTQVLSGSLVSGAGTALVSCEAIQQEINGNGKIYQIPRIGGAGAASTAVAGAENHPGANGSTGGGLTLGTGGGGSGGNEKLSTAGTSYSGAGASGTCFCGGPGGGGLSVGSDTTTGNAGGAYGGAGGAGKLGATTNEGIGCVTGGGAGNPGGAGTGSTGYAGGTGCGGLMLLFVRGSLTIAATGQILNSGSAGGNASNLYTAGGGGSGGGIVMALYGTSYSNSGTININGGSAGVATSGAYARSGGAGGAGYVLVEQVDI